MSAPDELAQLKIHLRDLYDELNSTPTSSPLWDYLSERIEETRRQIRDHPGGPGTTEIAAI